MSNIRTYILGINDIFLGYYYHLNQELVMDINESLSPFIYPHEMDINEHICWIYDIPTIKSPWEGKTHL